MSVRDITNSAGEHKHLERDPSIWNATGTMRTRLAYPPFGGPPDLVLVVTNHEVDRTSGFSTGVSPRISKFEAPAGLKSEVFDLQWDAHDEVRM